MEGIMTELDRKKYYHPLQGRYASDEMQELYSDDEKITGWRRMWLENAIAQQKLGVPITDRQIAEMKEYLHKIDYTKAAEIESKLRHDVMSHVKTFGIVCPSAKRIIHQGFTSCDVTDNAELIQIKKALGLTCIRTARVLAPMACFATEYAAMPTLGFSHYQPAQPVTVGRRTCMWAQDLLADLLKLEYLASNLKFRGIRGTTGTQASFMALFEGDETKVIQLEELITKACGFSNCFSITGQTYSRKQDTEVIFALSTLAASAKKIATDIRLLSNLKEFEEPRTDEQVGSSAMVYKKNPMLSERLTSIARYLMGLVQFALQTHSEQWLERSLDDSAIRRIIIPEAFLAADAILLILQNIFEGIVIFPKIIERNLSSELPFMVTEEIIIAMTRKGADRQDVHERLRVHSSAASVRIKQEGLDNNLVQLIKEDDYFTPVHNQLDNLLDPGRFIGRAPQQVSNFLEKELNPVLSRYREQGLLDVASILSV